MDTCDVFFLVNSYHILRKTSKEIVAMLKLYNQGTIARTAGKKNWDLDSPIIEGRTG